MAKIDAKLIDKINLYITNLKTLPETCEDEINISFNNVLVEYFKQNPFMGPLLSKKDEPVLDAEGKQIIINLSDEMLSSIRSAQRWNNELLSKYKLTYCRLNNVDNIPTKAELLEKQKIKELHKSYISKLKPASVEELSISLAKLLYNSEINNVHYNVSRIIYAIRRIQKQPDTPVTALFAYSIVQGNGKSTFVNTFANACKSVGLNAVPFDIESMTNQQYADTRYPLDNIHVLTQESFLKETQKGINRTMLEKLIDGQPIQLDVKFKNRVTQKFDGLIVLGGNCIPKHGDRRYSVIHLIESKIKLFKNTPSIKELTTSWEYLLNHVVDEEVLKLLVSWEELNNTKRIQNTTTKGNLYNILQQCVDYDAGDSVAKNIQIQSILSRFGKTLPTHIRAAYKEELQCLLDDGIIRSNDKKLTNGSSIEFCRNDLAKLDYGDEQRLYDYENHTSLIKHAVYNIFQTIPRLENKEPTYKGEFLEWGMHGYDKNGEYEVLNIPYDIETPEGYVTCRTQSNCRMKRFLYESDNLSLCEQKELMDELIKKGIVYRVVYSGSKSLHIIIEIDKECENIKEYKFFWKTIAENLGIDLNKTDRTVSDNSRLTRRPGIMRKFIDEKWVKHQDYRDEAVKLFNVKVDDEEYQVEQKLLYDGFNVYECYQQIKQQFVKSQVENKQVVVQSLRVYGDNSIDKFMNNWANKHDADLSFPDGKGHSVGTRLIGAAKTAGFDNVEIESWLSDNCNRYHELKGEWKGLL